MNEEVRMNALTSEEILKARKVNAYYVQRLGFTTFKDAAPQDWGGYDSEEFARHVEDFQATNGLVVDGIAGPKTLAALRGTEWLPRGPQAEEYLLVSGRRVPVPFKVITWQEPGGLSFHDHPKSWARRGESAPIHQFVIHWDAALSSHSAYNTLVSRGLSVQLLLDADGTVYQCLDLQTVNAQHAGAVNDVSVGVEICNPVELRFQSKRHPRPVVHALHANTDVVEDVLDYYDVQKERAAQLCTAVCDALRIPRRLPGALAPATGPYGVLPKKLRVPRAFHGVVGHFHVASKKWDPGFGLWPSLLAAGFELAQSEAV